ncbi:MAG: alpha-ketoglutarate-dependent dioxygenase AlkB [Gammaproteobacteria bacterium]|nr:alpha-ketoglutarate-dependent dioxygenase AlkB [Gammaproteobacteria bacterium]
MSQLDSLKNYMNEKNNNSDVIYLPGLIPLPAARDHEAQLREQLAWRCDPITIYGKTVLQPRLTAWIADDGIDYRYSGITMTPEPWTPVMESIRREVQRAANCEFNSVLVNLYRDGNDYMGWHRDNEPELGQQPVIASLSLGATRFFDLRHRSYRDNKLPVQRYTLNTGDLLIMRGRTQEEWQHRVPKQKKILQSRINLSFRQTLPRHRKRS